MAEALFVALATDTGWFRFASTTAETLRLAASLTEAGAVPTASTRTSTRTTRQAACVSWPAMARTQTDPDGRLITLGSRSRLCRSRGRTDRQRDIINLTLSVAGPRPR